MRYGVGRFVAAVVGCCGALAGLAQGQVKISQVYTGADATANGPSADYIELYNASDAAVNVAGWSVQYTSGATSSNAWRAVPLTGSIPARGYYLIQITDTRGGGIASGTAQVPTPNASRSPLDNPSFDGLRNTGSVAVLNTTTLLGTGVCPPSPIDLVGWRFSGTAVVCAEGTPLGAPSVTATPPQVIKRKCEGLTDTNSNTADFELVGFSALRNTASAAFTGVTVAIGTPAGGAIGVPPGGSVTFTVTGTDCGGVAGGVSATADLTAIGGGASVALSPTGVPGEFTLTTAVGASVSAGEKSVPIRINGTGGAFGTAIVRVTVTTPNDECSGATTISGPGPFAFNTTGATTSADAQSFVGCDNGTSLGGTIQRDVFFRWVAPTSGAVAFSTAGTQPAGFDARLAAYAGVCPPGAAPVACNDNDGVTQGTATIAFTATAGETYYIQVGATGDTGTPTGVLTLSANVSGACCTANFGGCVVQAQDACVNAGGAFRGVGTTCSSISPCATGPLGACCNATAGCNQLSQTDCANPIFSPQPSTWLGADTVCQAGACPPGGSCCVGTSCSYRTQAGCAAISGVWAENSDATVCSSASAAPCLPRGRCCFPNGSCLLGSLESNCTGAGGTWAADPRVGACDFQTVCAAPASVVCCRGTTCAVVAQADCTLSGPASGTQAVARPALSSCAGVSNTFSGCCFADYDKSGQRTIDDIFIYLNGWFANSPYTRVGGDGTGTRTIDDIFLFLNAWFAGCN